MRPNSPIMILSQALRPALGLPQTDYQDPISWDLVDFSIRRHRVGAVLWKSCRGRETEDTAVNRINVRLRRVYEFNTLLSLRQRAAETRLAQLLEQNRISFCFLKGAGLADQLYTSPSLRTAKDVDVLILRGNAQHAIDVLNGNGYRYRPATLRSKKFAATARQYQDMKLHKDLTFIDPTYSVVLEIHERLFNYEPDGFTTQFVSSLESNPMPSIRNIHYVLYLIVHGSLSFWHRLKWVADLSLLLRKFPEEFFSQLMCLADQYGCRNAVISSAILVEKVFPGSLTADWLNLVDQYKGNSEVVKLSRLNWETLTKPEYSPPKLPLKAYLSSGPADLIFPERIGFWSSAWNRWLSSLTIRV